MTELHVTVGTDNQITTSGYSYDAVGNMTTNPMGSGSITYDAENRLTMANGAVFTLDCSVILFIW